MATYSFYTVLSSFVFGDRRLSSVDSFRLCLPCVILAFPKEVAYIPNSIRFLLFVNVLVINRIHWVGDWPAQFHPSSFSQNVSELFQTSLHGNCNGQGRKLPTILHLVWRSLTLSVTISLSYPCFVVSYSRILVREIKPVTMHTIVLV